MVPSVYIYFVYSLFVQALQIVYEELLGYLEANVIAGDTREHRHAVLSSDARCLID
jgi:hypothetical protein